MNLGEEKGKGERPKPDHEAIEAILAADPRCEKDDPPDEEGETTITFLGPQAARRLRENQEKAGND